MDNLFQLNYVNPTNLGNINVGQTGPPIHFNFEFNAPTTLNGFRIVSQGDVSTDLTPAHRRELAPTASQQSARWWPTHFSLLPLYLPSEIYEGTPTYPGIRTSAILVRGAKQYDPGFHARLPDRSCRSGNYLSA